MAVLTQVSRSASDKDEAQTQSAARQKPLVTPRTFFALLIVGLGIYCKLQLDSGVGFLVLCRICLLNERTGNDGTLGEGIAELTAEEVLKDSKLQGTVGIVTGSNTGIGKETARVLAMQGMHVIMACRSSARCNAAKKDIEPFAAKGGSLEPIDLDMSDLSSVKKFAEIFLAKGLTLNYLIHNAAVLPTTYQQSAQGIELGFAVNSLSVFYLTQLLLPKLKASSPSKIIDVTSATVSMVDETRWANTKMPLTEKTFYEQGFLPLPAPLDFSTIGAYSHAKVSSSLIMAQFRRTLKGSGVDFATVHPGLIPTELTRHSNLVSFGFHVVPAYTDKLGLTRAHKTIPQGAATTVWTVANNISGAFYYADNAPHDNCPHKVYMEVMSDETFAIDAWMLHGRLLNEFGFSF